MHFTQDVSLHFHSPTRIENYYAISQLRAQFQEGSVSISIAKPGLSDSKAYALLCTTALAWKVSNPALLLISCVTLGKFPPLSELQFLHI